MTKINTFVQRRKSAAQRFEEKFEKSDGCWLWRSAVGSRGYGIFWAGAGRKSVMAHRFAYELAHGREPDPSLVIMHSCDNPVCVNPAHLSLGTILENALDAQRKGRLAVGERNGGGKKLTYLQVVQIKGSASEISGAELARRLGVSKYVVNAIRRGDLWRSVSANG